ncbi:MAG: tRNA uridine-5-carboxymethylaminomethyl(34) synthesis GTPase MnmE [Bacilli bacterium]
MNDTIAAISTTMGVGAISIIRISGDSSISIVNKIWSGKDLSKVLTHTIHYGYIKSRDEIIDEVLVSVMKAPKTFTMEDIVEINCHGGITTTNKILELLLTSGARLAEPGEFTKRAFLNGRIDLVNAESIMDLLQVKTEQARKLAIKGLDGHISLIIKKLRQKMLEIIATIEVNIDYPEYEDIEIMTNMKIKPQLAILKSDLEKIINESETGQIIKNGIKTVIVGRPNVGKSSLLNCLLKEEKAIVTEIEGTTRDTVEGTINLDGILLNIIDTAGIRNTNDIVEKIGVERSLSLIKEADLVIVVVNNNEQLTSLDKDILLKTQATNSIVVVNKNDLNTKLNYHELEGRQVVFTNTCLESGIEELTNKIKELFNLNEIETKDYNYLSNIRQIALAKEAYNIILEAEQGIQNSMPIDIVEIDLKRSWDKLGEIIGDTYTEELLDQLFSQFCIGK